MVRLFAGIEFVIQMGPWKVQRRDGLSPAAHGTLGVGSDEFSTREKSNGHYDDASFLNPPR
jgi:hypothetical protein